ncbi:hypothetical protein A0H81_11964 [Grifola frondosa]|uniref:Uncharacterized protein n=1 Tax=Grifola frondosa TaxID=5627 RepID=A0A1C7LU81_GRIFR|nr:hypothetical protein A0H81_11964 [Grifola frondosa]
MDALGTSPEMMKSLLMRSTTPASNEKVLLYLEGMQKTPPMIDDDDRGSDNSRSTRGKDRASIASRLGELAEEPVDYGVTRNGGGEDIRSDVQEVNGSDVGRTIPIHTTGVPDREPGPDDPPGPHFESYGSSFGISDLCRSLMNPFQQYGMTPINGGGISMGPGVADPASPTRSRHTRSGSASKVSPSMADGGGSNGLQSPKSAARPLSPMRPGGIDRPWSPRTAASAKSRNTQKTNYTVYPPLPESIAQEEVPPRRDTKTPSIAPSESASQAKSKHTVRASAKSAKSVKSVTDMNGNGAGEGYATSQRARSQAPMSPRSQASQIPHAMAAAALLSPVLSKRSNHDPEATPTPSRPVSPVGDLDAEEQQMVHELLMRPSRSRTSYAPSAMAPSMLEPEIQNSHFHDMELCQLLHALDQQMGEPVKRAVRKAVRARVKKLGMKYDNESIKQYRKSYHDHDPTVHLAAALAAVQPGSKRSTQLGTTQEPPEWAKDLIEGMINMRERLDNLAPKIEKSLRSSRGGSYVTEGRGYPNGHHHHYPTSEMNGAFTQSPMTQTVGIHTQPTDSMFQTGETEMIRESTHLHTLPGSMHHHDGSMHGAIREEDMYDDEDDGRRFATTDGDTRGRASEYMPTTDREDSPGRQYLEEELYKLRVKPTGSQSVATHKTWEVARDDGEDYDEGEAQAAVTDSGMPEIPDGNTGGYPDLRGNSPPLPPLPHQDSRGELVSMHDAQMWHPNDYGNEPRSPPPWQRVHQRLLSWAIVWPMVELDNAVNSCGRGMQVDEVALSIWSTQTYKRYVRAKMTDSPPGRVDRLFVPPNMADAISTAVYNGRHGDACGMLRDLWAPFGLEGIPRLLIVLAKHRNDDNHWVVHRYVYVLYFSLPDGSLTTYDTYPERCLPDGRPLGWWFAIRIAWPDAIYPSPDHLMQKMVRLHRPMQLGIENSVAAAGIWRNLLMGSRAERSLDLERLRDLISTEVKNLRQRKQLGKLSIGSPRPNWEDMH